MIDAFKISPENYYNMYETDSSIDTNQEGHIIIDTLAQSKYELEIEHQEWVTSIEYF